MLNGSDYEKILYSKVLSFIGYDKVNPSAFKAVREYLSSEDFDKEAFMSYIKDESDIIELKVKLDLLKFFIKAEKSDDEKTDCVCTQADLDECIEQTLALAEEIVATRD